MHGYTALLEIKWTLIDFEILVVTCPFCSSVKILFTCLQRLKGREVPALSL